MEAKTNTQTISTGMRRKRKLIGTIVKENDQATRKKTALVRPQTWDALDLDTLSKILELVPTHDLFWNVSSVCHVWQLACWAKLFWNSDNGLDLTVAALLPSYRDDDKSASSMPKDYNNHMSPKLMKHLLETILSGIHDANGNSLEKWRSSIKTFRVPSRLEISNEHLCYVADRTSHLVNLELLGCSKITPMGFRKAISDWKFLETIHLGEFSNRKFPKFLEDIGKICSRLKELHICKKGFTLTPDIAILIAQKLPRLDKLGFRSAHLFKEGILATFFIGFRHILLDFSDCFLLNDKGIALLGCDNGNAPIACFGFKLSIERTGGGYRWCITEEDHNYCVVGIWLGLRTWRWI